MIPPKKPLPVPKQEPVKKISFTQVRKQFGHRSLIYGPGGIGKTTLACCAPGDVAYIDSEDSLPVLQGEFNERGVPMPLIVPASNWQEVRTCLAAPGWDAIKTIGIEVTRLEEWAAHHVLRTVKTDKNQSAANIEAYGWGKGYVHIFEIFMPFLALLDTHVRAGRNIVLVAHDCVHTVPNPSGEDWIRYEPRLQDPASGKASIRLRVKEWCDHVLFYSYDVVAEDRKGKGSGTRTIYRAELPFCMAKSRTGSEPIAVDSNNLADVWSQIIR